MTALIAIINEQFNGAAVLSASSLSSYRGISSATTQEPTDRSVCEQVGSVPVSIQTPDTRNYSSRNSKQLYVLQLYSTDIEMIQCSVVCSVCLQCAAPRTRPPRNILRCDLPRSRGILIILINFISRLFVIIISLGCLSHKDFINNLLEMNLDVLYSDYDAYVLADISHKIQVPHWQHQPTTVSSSPGPHLDPRTLVHQWPVCNGN